MNILGISAFYHDSAACLVQDGRIAAAAQEERFTRKKHDASFPEHAIRYCLEEAGIEQSQLDYIGFYDKPLLKFERILETYVGTAPKGLASFMKAMPMWIKEKIWTKSVIAEKTGFEGEFLFGRHHESHAASAFFPSPFEEAAVMTLDGVGEWTTASYGVGHGNEMRLQGDIRFPHSIGLLYSAFTYYTGFRVNSGEYKVMGLAPYGEPKYVDLILEELIDLRDDGSFKLNMKYFDFLSGLRMTNKAFDRLMGGPPRKPETPISQREMDLARSVQVVVEEAVLRISRYVHGVTGQKNLCLAGGVALNCVGNGRLLREGPFENIWIQPAAGDAGGALGVALMIHHMYLGNERHTNGSDHMAGSYLGPHYSDDDIAAYVARENIPARRVDGEAVLADEVARILSEENVVGWFQGRMEFGPRALGGRSILGDPRSEKMQTTMNLKIKYRESFRPFAPSVLRERVADYFELDGDSPYMLLVAGVKEDHRIPMSDEQQKLFGIDKLKVPRSTLPAITHVDYSARIQTVSADTNPRYHALLAAFEKRTGCPVVVNTSFNVRGEPIVMSPADAYRCFMRTEMDYLVLGNHILAKTDQPELHEDKDWRDEFELD
ncbi:MAG: carbamoyltransferase [Planctomycetota bacterium]